jgi:hypothetical protein
MEPRDFCLWLQGFSELNAEVPTQEQWDSIREHLATVFNKITPEVKFAEAKPKPPVNVDWQEVLKNLPKQEIVKPLNNGFFLDSPVYHNGYPSQSPPLGKINVMC